MENYSKFEEIQNNTSYIPYSERLDTYIVPVVFALIFLVGTLGNGTLVLIFVRHRTMRNVPNTYILSLALGDLLVIVFCVPFTAIVYILESWPWGKAICKLLEGSKDVSIGVSVFTLTALSEERYCAIVNPIRRHVSKPLTIVTALAIWVFSTILALPSTLFSTVDTARLPNNQIIEYCTPYPEQFGDEYSKIIVLFKFLAYYAIPLCIIGGFYTAMARHLVYATRNIPGEHQGQSIQVQARKKVAKVVLTFVIIFTLSFLPIHVFSLWFHLHPYSHEEYNDYWHAFRITAFCLSFINSCINPIALYWVSKAFRKHFNEYLFCCVKGTSRSSVTKLNRFNVSSSRNHN